MSLLSMVEAKLPPGFRFHPRDDELICDYVAPKITGDGNRSFFGCQMLIEVDLNKCEPWNLPEMALVGGKQWYFFSLKDRKYATGQRTNRATASGYWKATGKDKPVVRKGSLVGMRKTLVFYRGRAPKGKKTEWVMHEFRIESPADPVPKPTFEEDWVLCRVFFKSRGISTKPSIKTSYENIGTPSLSLLNNAFTFSQTLPNLEGSEQVPCFSSFPPSHESHSQIPEAVPHFPTVERNLPTKSLTYLGDLPNISSSVNPLSSDNKEMSRILNHFTKMDGNHRVESPKILGQRSSDSFLPETNMPSVWNPFQS